MKVVDVSSGWTTCPYLWRTYLRRTIRIERYPTPEGYPRMWMVTIFGFVIFLEGKS